jgi:hypothetical protein
VKRLAGEEEMMLDKADDRKLKERFRKARKGDILVCPFQCDACPFRNI